MNISLRSRKRNYSYVLPSRLASPAALLHTLRAVTARGRHTAGVTSTWRGPVAPTTTAARARRAMTPWPSHPINTSQSRGRREVKAKPSRHAMHAGTAFPPSSSSLTFFFLAINSFLQICGHIVDCDAWVAGGVVAKAIKQ